MYQYLVRTLVSFIQFSTYKQKVLLLSSVNHLEDLTDSLQRDKSGPEKQTYPQALS